MANLIKIKVDTKDKVQVKKLDESLKKKEALKNHVKNDLPLRLFKPLRGGA